MTVVRKLARWLLARVRPSHSIVSSVQLPDAWRDPAIPERQHEAYATLLANLRRGEPRQDLRVAAAAIGESGIANPSIVEIGCGSGYYSEVLELLAGPVRYTGIDYSAAMIALARSSYARTRFVVGDATTLPVKTAAADIAMSGNSLMHIAGYAEAIAETARIAARWCVFHSVPVAEHRPTTFLRKKAYGVDVFELMFNRGELESRMAASGLAIRSMRDSYPYDLSPIVGEHTRLVTYACEKLR